MKSVERATYVAGEQRHENDAEHLSYGTRALLLAPETALERDGLRVLELILVHDLVEIIAGDVPAYDLAAREAAKAVEARAAEELFAPFPPDVRDRLTIYGLEFCSRTMTRPRHASPAPWTASGARAERLQRRTQLAGTQGHRPMTRTRNLPVIEIDETLASAAEMLYERARAARMWDDDPHTVTAHRVVERLRAGEVVDGYRESGNSMVPIIRHRRRSRSPRCVRNCCRRATSCSRRLAARCTPTKSRQLTMAIDACRSRTTTATSTAGPAMTASTGS